MKPIHWRQQLGIVASGYAAVVLLAIVLVYKRHMQYVNHPADVMSSSGMYAAGDMMLELFIGGLFLIPTVLLMERKPTSSAATFLFLDVSSADDES